MVNFQIIWTCNFGSFSGVSFAEAIQNKIDSKNEIESNRVQNLDPTLFRKSFKIMTLDNWNKNWQINSAFLK